MVTEDSTSYSVDNDQSFRRALNRAIATVNDLRIPFGLILSDFYRSEQSIFKLKGPGLYPPFAGKRGPDGKTEYQRRKLRKYGIEYPLLVRTGKLAASLLGPSNPGSIAFIGPLSLVFGTSIEYGIYHQSDRPRKKIPLRKFLFIGPEAPRFATSEQQGRLQRWNNILNDYVLKKLRQEVGANG